MTPTRPEIRNSATYSETISAVPAAYRPHPALQVSPALGGSGTAAVTPRPASRHPRSPGCLSKGPSSGLEYAPVVREASGWGLLVPSPGAWRPRWEGWLLTHPSPHWSPQQVSMSSADTSTLTCPLVRMQIRSEMASTAPNACGDKPHQMSPTPGLWALPARGPQWTLQTFLVAILSQC